MTDTLQKIARISTMLLLLENGSPDLLKTVNDSRKVEMIKTTYTF